MLIALFLPPIYQLTDRLNARCVLAKYLEQYRSMTKDAIALLKRFNSALEFRHAHDLGDVLSSFFSNFKKQEDELVAKRTSSDVDKFELICIYVVLTCALRVYTLCRIDREYGNLLVEQIKNPESLMLLYDKKKIYCNIKANTFYVDVDCTLKKYDKFSILFSDLI